MINYGINALNLFCLKNNSNKLNPSKTSVKYINSHFDENKELFNYLNNVFTDLQFPKDLGEILYRIKNNISSNPLCQICKKHVKFQGFTNGYSKTCSQSCMAKLEHLEKLQTNFYEKRKLPKIKMLHPEWFFDWSTISKENDDWILQHFLRMNKKHICPDTNKLETGLWAKNEKNKNIIYYIKHRYQNSTDIEENLYWLYNNIQNRQVCPVCGGQLKFMNFIQGYQRVCSHSCATLHPDTRKKLIKTNNIRHGSNFYLGTKECIEKSKITIKKRNKENYYNNPQSDVTTHSSIGEKTLFYILKELYPDVVQYYRDKRYSNQRNGYCWECDFYIKSIDLFIEYQGFRSHGGHPYNKNNQDDINTINKLKNRINSNDISENTKKFLKSIIYVWTNGDVYKRYIAHKNNLNYLEIFEKPNKLNKEMIIEKINNIINN